MTTVTNDTPLSEVSIPKAQEKQAPDPFDPARLRLSQDFSAAIGVKKLLTTVPVRKPSKEWFVRCHPDPAYRIETFVIELKHWFLRFPGSIVMVRRVEEVLGRWTEAPPVQRMSVAVRTFANTGGAHASYSTVVSLARLAPPLRRRLHRTRLPTLHRVAHRTGPQRRRAHHHPVPVGGQVRMRVRGHEALRAPTGRFV
jgi:hypothetical protein